MCGIVGFAAIPGTQPDRDAVAAMIEALSHRGPDGRGHYDGGDVLMMHARLAIIDLETGDQPIRGARGAALIANAEIYNHVELRARFADVPYITNSDCEAALRTYEEEGVGFAKSLRGMYAIALHDPIEGHLLLARDPFGIKPLYYAETPTGLAFASEPAALLASGLVARNEHVPARDELLSLRFTTGSKTIFEGIQRVLPGETIVVSAGHIIRRERLSALPEGGPEKFSEDEALERLDAALRDSVAVHQRSDVPYGMFLSGGVDSSALLAVMARLNDRPVRAFTIGFEGADVPDEREHARRVAKKMGAEHVEISFTEKDFWSYLPKVAAALDDPAADYATLPTYKLGEEAGRSLKVVLCGEGGDELFGGYSRYRSALRPWWQGGGRRPRRRAVMEGLGVLRVDPPGWRDGLNAAEAIAKAAGRSPLQVWQAVDCEDWLSHDLLLKLDRCLMIHGVEGRTPMLDPVIADIAFRLPDQLKIRGRLGKWLLRRWLSTQLPEAEPFTRKRGFTVPAAQWIAKAGPKIGKLVAKQPGVVAACNPVAVEALYTSSRKHERAAAWVLLFYAVWHQRHIVGREVGGDTFEFLSGSA